MQTEIRNGCLYVSGEISTQTLNDAGYRRFAGQCRQPETEAIDFSGVSHADSACISLILTALRSRSGSLKFQALPESVQALTALYEVQEWIHT